jgi:hypothetical protein
LIVTGETASEAITSVPPLEALSSLGPQIAAVSPAAAGRPAGRPHTADRQHGWQTPPIPAGGPVQTIPWYPAVPPPSTQSLPPRSPPTADAAVPARPILPSSVDHRQLTAPAPLADRNDNSNWVSRGSASPGYALPVPPVDLSRVRYQQATESPGFVQAVGQTAIDVAKRLFSWPF